MVVWRIERGAGGSLSSEELKRIVSVLSAFSWSLFFQSASLLCQICKFGKCSWCRHNVLDDMICAVKCHQQRIGVDMSG